jgi:hypothetical protein
MSLIFRDLATIFSKLMIVTKDFDIYITIISKYNINVFFIIIKFINKSYL